MLPALYTCASLVDLHARRAAHPLLLWDANGNVHLDGAGELSERCDQGSALRRSVARPRTRTLPPRQPLSVSALFPCSRIAYAGAFSFRRCPNSPFTRGPLLQGLVPLVFELRVGGAGDHSVASVLDHCTAAGISHHHSAI